MYQFFIINGKFVCLFVYNLFKTTIIFLSYFTMKGKKYIVVLIYLVEIIHTGIS